MYFLKSCSLHCNHLNDNEKKWNANKVDVTMIHKVAVISILTILCLCASNYYSLYISIYFYLDTKQILVIIAFSVIFLFTSFLFLFITSLITIVKVGKPPLESLVIAYKYGFSDTVTSTNIFDDMKVFPESDTIQICYENRHGPFGIAHGVVIKDECVQKITEKARDSLDLHGYNLLQTKEIPNAVYITCPTLPWLSYFGVWLVLRIVYPKLYKYTKKRKLSAYPVVELYKRFSIVLVAPLSCQDYFVVPEAKPYLHRSFSCPNTSMSTTTNISQSTRHSGHEGDDHSSTPKLSKGNAIKL